MSTVAPSETQALDTSRAAQQATDKSFLRKTHSAVRSHLQATLDLPTFLQSVHALTLDERVLLVKQARILFEDNYVHLPLKVAMHGVNPRQRLRLLQHRLEQKTPETMGTDFEFHREMLDIFNSVRDLHTNYLLPAPFNGMVAFLPFDIEECYEDGEPHYYATHLMSGFYRQYFKSGVEITHWNGVPIQRAIEVSADLHAGSNLAARHARGIEGLTKRSLRSSLPPDALWVNIGFLDQDEHERELRQGWLVTPMLPNTNTGEAVGKGDRLDANAAQQGLDIEQDTLRRVKQMLFAPQVIEQAKQGKQSQPSDKKEIASTMPDVIRAKRIKTKSGDLAYIRIYTFSVDDPQAFVEECIRLLALLPQNGLVLDVRGNGGGHIWASEGLLQLFTPRKITPEPVQFINTPLNLRICTRHEGNPVGIDLTPWVKSMRQSVETAAVYSAGFPITPYDFANHWGQHYYGPVVLITDGRCYSATDIFAAGFKDHGIGQILGVDDNTGAGGANVWTQGLLQLLLQLPEPEDTESPYQDLPQGADMRVSIRRTLRTGELSGTPLEDLGVIPDERHFMTRNDLLKGNEDLIEHAVQLLKDKTTYVLDVDAQRDEPKTRVKLKVRTAHFSRLDVYENGRPERSYSLKDGSHHYALRVDEKRVDLTFLAYEEGRLVAARKVWV